MPQQENRLFPQGAPCFTQYQLAMGGSSKAPPDVDAFGRISIVHTEQDLEGQFSEDGKRITGGRVLPKRPD